MAPSVNPNKRSGLETVRAEILTALHLGRLAPGDRIPSVRELAHRAGLNVKTVHRAYKKLASEGLLEMHPGRGTFVASRNSEEGGSREISQLIRFAKRSQAAARECGLSTQRIYEFAKAFNGDGLQGVPMAIVECNREQCSLIADQLEKALGIEPRQVGLQELKRRGSARLHGMWGVITTDCHLDEVSSLLQEFGVPVYSIALDGVFPRQIVEYARRKPITWIVRDRTFGPVFSRLLKHMKVPAETIERIQFVEPEELDISTLEPSRRTVLASPLLRRRTAWLQAHGIEVQTADWSVERDSLERLRAELALDYSREP